MLRTPSLCAASLFHDHRHIESAFQQEASYLFHEKNQPGIDLGHLTFECTKAGLALKLFLVLGALGERGLGEYIERQWDLAIQTYEYIQQQPDFEYAVRPQSNIVCFRIMGSDQKQLQIRDALIAQGHFYLTSTSFRGKRYLRLTLMNPNTTLEDMQRLINMIRKIAEGIVLD
jgi:L-2,4-diaminobutyrate decarboxylase